jgi:hypothetical protein
VVQINLTARKLASLPMPQKDSFILTRQTSLSKISGRPDLVILKSDQPEAQLWEICRSLQLPPETWEPLQRCSKCNQVLQPVPSDQVAGLIPDYISRKHQQFFHCPQCQRVFWEGSHQQQIKKRLQDLRDHFTAQ